MRIRNAFVRGSAAAFLSAWLVAPAAAQTARPDSTAPAPIDRSRIRIDNFGQVSPVFYRGAQPKGRDYADLAALGVKTIIDLTGDDGDAAERMLTERAGMKYEHIAMTTREAPTASQLDAFLEIVSDPANQPVYVHCVGGRHRTGVMTAVYRMNHDGWESDRAFAEMKRYKFGADFLHPEFKTFVYGYRGAPADASAAAAGVKVK